MNKLTDKTFWGNSITTVSDWISENIFVTSNLLQLCIIIICLVIALYISSRLRPSLQSYISSSSNAFIAGLSQLSRLVMPLSWMLLNLIALGVAIQMDYSHPILNIAASLIAAWIIINAASIFIIGKTWSRIIAAVVWTIAALNILDLLDPTLELLDKFAFELGEARVSALTVTKAIFLLIILLWFAKLFSRLFESSINTSRDLTPSIKVLFAKVISITFIAIAVLIVISSVGIDLTAFAVFGGALGVGIGLGLQKIVSNFFSGIILLLDKSIKPGDVITIGGKYGWVTTLGGRYVSVRTFEGKEHLIPNENLISQEVINWSHSDELIRYSIPVGIHYQSDVRKAMEICLETARENKRILKDPEPAVFLVGFGDSSVNLEISVWINDPQNGFFKTQSEILFVIWDKFHEHGIEIPYPQRDLHIRSVDPEISKFTVLDPKTI
jgi:small-conductance mechanosensitive channel